ncbi:MAG: AMP-binding protein [Rickettsiaceae bacterium]|nr:AMP-binding protein [Rickettsiaceae bacterium]
MKTEEDTLISRIYHLKNITENSIAYNFLHYHNDSINNETINYGGLYSWVESLACHLEKFGQKNARVLIVLPSSLEYIVAFLGCLRTRYIAVPASLPQSLAQLLRLNSIIKHSKPSFLITSSSVLNHQSYLAIKTVIEKNEIILIDLAFV